MATGGHQQSIEGSDCELGLLRRLLPVFALTAGEDRVRDGTARRFLYLGTTNLLGRKTPLLLVV